jgi:hypothetical protein
MKGTLALSVPFLCWALALIALGPSCGGDAARGAGGDTDADGDADTDTDTDTDGDTDADDGCSDAAKVVYVVDSDNTLYTFDPPTKAFEVVGVVNCGNGSSPYSMAVTREAVAYVLFQNGDIFEVSTADASCTATPYVTGQAGFGVFGMGYASDGEGSTEETLYVANDASLASIGDDWIIDVIGSISGDPELTGNGLGELWGFFPQSTVVHISRIDKASAAESGTLDLTSLSNGASAWAFAYWGGAFYVFYQADADPSTNVYRVQADDGQIETWMQNTGRRIVGAGVSTCAPTTVQ